MTRDRWYHTDKPAEQILYVRSAETMRRMALSYDALAADVYWIRALQHFGGDAGSRTPTSSYDLLYPLLDLATSLDPHFNIAYRFGVAVSRGAAAGRTGPARSGDRAAAEGHQGDARQVAVHQDAGFVYYFRYKDYETAADWFKRGERHRRRAVVLEVAGREHAGEGSRSCRRRGCCIEAIVETADNDFMKKDALRRLRQLDTMDDMDLLREIVRRYRERMPGARPVTWQTLIAARILRGVPQDRDGFDFTLDPVTGDIRLDAQSSLAPLPTETPDAQSPSPTRCHPPVRAVALPDWPAADARAASASASFAS